MSEETSTTSTTEATNDLGLPQDLYDRIVTFQNEDYPGDEAFSDESEAEALAFNMKAEAYLLRLAVHSIVSEITGSLEMNQLFGGASAGDLDKAADDLNRFLDLNDRLTAITGVREPAGV